MTLMLLDSASLWYRAYYGMPDTLLSPTGTPVNAIRGFLDMTARLIGMYSPNRIVACIEGDWRPSWRVELFPEYKANRLEDETEDEEEPETLTPQIPILLDLLKDERFYVKLCSFDKISAVPKAHVEGSLPFMDMVPFAQACVAVAPDRVLFGTDWPHGNTFTPGRTWSAWRTQLGPSIPGITTSVNNRST